MVTNEMLVQGVDLTGMEQKLPVILQMNDDDFPKRFLRDLASPELPPISSTTIVNIPSDPLYQPVQRMLNLAMVDLSCSGLANPRIDPTRILSAGLVIRRVVRKAGSNGQAYEDYDTLSAWMSNPAGQFQWVTLNHDQECWDPDPTKRPQLKSGQADLDQQLAALYLSTANTESTTPAFAAPHATCAALGRTVFYAVIPTASSEVSDTQPQQPPLINQSDLIGSLPPLLRSSQFTTPPSTPTPPPTVDYRWMSDEFLNIVYPPTPSTSTPPTAPAANNDAKLFRGFTTALRMLHTVFGAFDDTPEGNAILNLLNQHIVIFINTNANFDPFTNFAPFTDPISTMPMGVFYQTAKAALLDVGGYPSAPVTPPTVRMPDYWEPLTDQDQSALVAALTAAIGPRSVNLKLLSPQGRFMDEKRFYKLRMFFRVKGDTPACPPKLFWSQYSKPFNIAAWYATGSRAHPPIPLPDPTSDFVKNAKPNCSFLVPGNLMSAIQGSSMSGLMSGAGGGGGLKLGWLCGFNIPLITICAFFVLNIFLSLLNIIFFWLPFIKICIPFPMPSPSTPDDGAP